MPSALYRPLEAGEKQQNGGFIYRPSHTNTFSSSIASGVRQQLYHHTGSATMMRTRKIFAIGILSCLLLLYLMWCAFTTYTEEIDLSSADTETEAVSTDERLVVCNEVFNDTRVYIHNRARQDYDSLPIIYFVTPTYPRREQVAELTRLAHTLLHVPRLHWIIANDHGSCSTFLDRLSNSFGIPHTHLASPMPDTYRKKSKKKGVAPRGVANRRAALQWLRQRNITSGVLYFGDDDNTYDLKLFSEIRDTHRVSMFPVGLIALYSISAPVVRKGKVVGFLDSWVAGRRWPVDMAGFAVNLAFMSEHPNANMRYLPGYEEESFLRSLGLTLDMIEPKANNCTEVLVWHTQTKNHEVTTIRIDHEYLDERSNLGTLFQSLETMGVALSSNSEGQKAIISKNGKAKPLNYFLS